MGCHKERVRELRRITKEDGSKGEPDDTVIVCADPMHCLHPGCRRQASPLCSVFYCSEHHIEICHKFPDTDKAQLECEVKT